MDRRRGDVKKALKDAVTEGKITEEDLVAFDRAKADWTKMGWKSDQDVRAAKHASMLQLSNSLRMKAGIAVKAVKADTSHIRRTTDATAIDLGQLKGDMVRLESMVTDLHNLHMKGKMSPDQQTLDAGRNESAES